MKKIKLLSILIIASLVFSSCEDEVEAPGTPFASFEANLGDITVTPGTDYNKSISIYAANVSGSDRTINLTLSGTLDAASYVAPTSVVIPANSNVGTLDLVFKDVNLDIIQDKTLTISMNGGEDFFVGEDVTLNVAKGCPSGESKLKIAVELDNWPEEVYWDIQDASGNIIMASNSTVAYGGYAGLSGTQRDAACLAAGTYSFRVFDQYGDGAGAISYTLDGVQIFSTDGSYAGGTNHTFTVN